MIKRVYGWLLLGLVWGLGAGREARGEVFNTARTLKPGALSLGIEPQAYLTNPLALQLNLHGGFAITRGLDLGIRYGFGLPGSYLPQYLGADLEGSLLREQRLAPSISLSGGLHITEWHHLGLDGTLLISKAFRRLEPYAGLDANLSLPPDVVQLDMRAVGGMNLHLSKVTEVMLELGLGLKNSPSYLSLGLNFYI